MIRPGLPRIAACERGTAAIEFGLLLPAVASVVAGTLYAGLVVYSASGLHSAVEQAARCYSVNATTCGSASATVSYAQNQYRGVGSPSFSASIASCGHQVSATVTATLLDAFSTLNVPLSATACFP